MQQQGEGGETGACSSRGEGGDGGMQQQGGGERGKRAAAGGRGETGHAAAGERGSSRLMLTTCSRWRAVACPRVQDHLDVTSGSIDLQYGYRSCLL